MGSALATVLFWRCLRPAGGGKRTGDSLRPAAASSGPGGSLSLRGNCGRHRQAARSIENDRPNDAHRRSSRLAVVVPERSYLLLTVNRPLVRDSVHQALVPNNV